MEMNERKLDTMIALLRDLVDVQKETNEILLELANHVQADEEGNSFHLPDLVREAVVDIVTADG